MTLERFLGKYGTQTAAWIIRNPSTALREELAKDLTLMLETESKKLQERPMKL
jgi:hypothetical protein